MLGHPAARSPAARGCKLLAPLGLVAGFVDATGGGGWGPVATPALLTDGRLEPRKVIGSVDTSEFAVSAAASLGFLVGLGAAGISWEPRAGPARRRPGRRARSPRTWSASPRPTCSASPSAG